MLYPTVFLYSGFTTDPANKEAQTAQASVVYRVHEDPTLKDFSRGSEQLKVAIRSYSFCSLHSLCTWPTVPQLSKHPDNIYYTYKTTYFYWALSVYYVWFRALVFSLFGLRFYIYEVLGQKKECVMFSFCFYFNCHTLF